MMTWNEFMEKLAKSGIPFIGIDEDAIGNIVVTFDLKEKLDGGGRPYLAAANEFADDVEA